MQIVVHDTLTWLETLFTAEARPKELFERASDLIFYAEDSLTAHLQPMMKQKASGGYAVMEAGQTDGFVALNQQQAWGLFNPSRARPVSVYQFEQLRQLDILNWLKSRATQYAQRLNIAHTLQLFVLPADHANRNVMIDTYGVSGFGGVAQFIALRLWPTAGNLRRLDQLLARLMVHQARFNLANGWHVASLGDWIVLEGVAAAFVAACFPDESFPWAVTWQKSADYDAALATIATLRGIDHYDEMQTNVYGAAVQIGAQRPPNVEPMDEETRRYTWEIMREAWAETDPIRIAAHLYGDELVARQGYPTVGLPPYAGFEIGGWLIQRFLDQQSLTVADCLAQPLASLHKQLQTD